MMDEPPSKAAEVKSNYELVGYNPFAVQIKTTHSCI